MRDTPSSQGRQARQMNCLCDAFDLSCPRLPDFSGYNIPKREKCTQMTTKYTKRPIDIPNGSKWTKWPLNLQSSSVVRHSKIFPNLYFGLKKCHLATLELSAVAYIGSILSRRFLLPSRVVKHLSAFLRFRVPGDVDVRIARFYSVKHTKRRKIYTSST
jgi:hypothetical protein